MKKGIRAYLLADTAIKAACPNVYSFPAEDAKTKPYMMLSRVSGSIDNTVSGSLDIYRETWQVDIIASTDAEAEAIKELVVSRMNCSDRVEMGSYTVYSCSLSNIGDNSALEMDGGDNADIRTTIELDIVRDRTATPTT
jgi:hypothetical protein